MPTKAQDEHFMQQALALAKRAEVHAEVPVGAVLVRDGKILGEGWNQPITSADPTAHAEIVALRAAATAEHNYRLPGSTLYVTLEPCSMCAGAIVHARVERIVYAAAEPKAGVAHSNGCFFASAFLNHHVVIESGVLQAQSSELISSFFTRRRAQKKALKQNSQEGSVPPLTDGTAAAD